MLNPSQLQEQHLNFMADHVLKLMKATDDYYEKQDIFLNFLKAVNKKEYDFYDSEMLGMNRVELKAIIDEVEAKGIYIHQPPFYGNTSMEDFEKIFLQHPEWCTKYKCVGIEKPLVIGDIYFIRLILAVFSLIVGKFIRALDTKI
jgi:hypothetical protein